MTDSEIVEALSHRTSWLAPWSLAFLAVVRRRVQRGEPLTVRQQRILRTIYGDVQHEATAELGPSRTASLCRVYDAQGRLTAIIDPMTRRRTEMTRK